MGLTQETVCHGICDCATLSRIENGRVTPRKTVISALLQRLGLPEENYYAFLSKNELEIEALKKEIMGYNIAEKPDECAAALQKLRALTEPDDLLTQQFTLRSQALLSRLKGGTPQEELALLHQTMCLTNPGFALDQIGQFLYTFEEVKLLNQIALCYSDLEQHPQALSIYCQLIEYIQRHYPEVILKNGQLHMILCNYARELNITQQYQQSILIAEKGRAACVQYSHYQFLPDFLALMAECYHFCGQDEKSATPASSWCARKQRNIWAWSFRINRTRPVRVLPHPSASADPAPAERRSWAQSCCLGRRCRPPHSTRPAAQPPAEHSKPKPPQVCSKAVSSSKTSCDPIVCSCRPSARAVDVVCHCKL